MIQLARFTASIALLLFTATAMAEAPVHTGLFSDRAVDGHDVVAYFTDGRPLAGKREFATEYKGATWLFASAEHLAAFELEPARYAPQYGGYCAWAVSQGYTASGDPDNWAIVDGKLYLNYNDDVQANWNKDRAGFIVLGDANWPGVLD